MQIQTAMLVMLGFCYAYLLTVALLNKDKGRFVFAGFFCTVIVWMWWVNHTRR